MSKEDPSSYTKCDCCGCKIYYDPGFHIVNGKKMCHTCFLEERNKMRFINVKNRKRSMSS